MVEQGAGPVEGDVAVRGRAPWRVRARRDVARAGIDGAGLAVAAAASVVWWVGADWSTPALALVAASAAALAVVDARTHRLPDTILLPTWAVAVVLLAGAALATGDGAAFARALSGAVLGFGAYAVLRLVHPPGLGFGDVKLAGLLGAVLGWLGWAELAVGLVSPFVLGGAWAVALLALRRATRSTAVAFGPFMVLGAALAAVTGPSVAAAYGWAP